MTAVGYQQYLDVAGSRDVGTFRSRLIGFAGELGFPLINATLVVEQASRPPLIAAVRNTPSGFEAVGSPTDAARDPVVARLKTATAPFVYDQATYVTTGSADLWEQQAPFGYRNGVAMALHMPGGRHFLMGVDSPDALPAHPDRLVRLMADLQLLAVFAQETAVRLLMPTLDDSEATPALTAREQEILRWTLAGKSSSVIGEILHISLSTVNYHLRSAMSKLAVSSKHQAAAKAHALGLL